MTDDLVKRLREEDFLSDWRISDYQRQERMELERAEAADRIEADAEVIKAAEALADAADGQLVYMDMCDDIGDLERNLRTALAAFHRAMQGRKGGE